MPQHVAAVSDVLRNLNMFVDGRGYAGRVEEVTPPKLAVKTEDVRHGGMDAPIGIDQGTEKMEVMLKTGSIDRDLLRLWGVVTGGQVAMTLRGALVSEDGAVTAIVMEMRGAVVSVDWGAWKPGEKASMTLQLEPRYYRLVHAGEEVCEVDVLGMRRVVGGVDQLAAQRGAIGL